MTVQSKIILSLIDKIADEELRRQITAQYYRDVEAQSGFVQNRIGHLEIDLREQLQQSLGETNEMIGEAVNLAREGGVALRELRSDFRTWIEQIVHLSEEIDDIRGQIAAHDREIASFRASRDQSIAERAQFKEDLAESKVDRASIHKELQIAAAERKMIMAQLSDIQRRLGMLDE